jgi:hypothetical protein
MMTGFLASELRQARVLRVLTDLGGHMTTPNSWDADPLDTPSTPQHAATPLGDESYETAGTSGGTYGSGSTTDEGSGGLKDQAAQTASTASEQAQKVGSTAQDEVKQVAGEAKEKATDLLADVKTQVTEQSRSQLQGLAAKLKELSDELDDMTNETQGTVTDLARQLSDKTRSLSTHLQDREPADLLEDVRSYARRRSGTFLVGAAAAGILAGRLTRGAKASTGSSTSSSTPSTPVSSDPPAPTGPGTYSGTAPTAGTYADGTSSAGSYDGGTPVSPNPGGLA